MFDDGLQPLGPVPCGKDELTTRELLIEFLVVDDGGEVCAAITPLQGIEDAWRRVVQHVEAQMSQGIAQ